MGRPLSFMDAVAKPTAVVGSKTLSAASSVLFVDDIIWILKVLFFFAAVTMVVCTIYRVSLWRSIASASQNPGNAVPSSSLGTNQPPANEEAGISGMGDIEQLPPEGILINIPLPTSSTNEGSTNTTDLAPANYTVLQMVSFALSI
ncbi:unnamed protein product [Sphagnum jensenii]|uniref:Uncharacterized protein n=1 Tax=Sphagnum jensenii TaxID=128206 RepID=A0ABP1A2X1_9BRYO